MKIMNSGIKKTKIVDSVSRTINKEGVKMIRKYMIVGVTLLTFLCNVLPAQAYINLQTPVTVTASGTLAGVTIAFSVALVAQGTGTAATTVDFTTPNGITDSGEALKIKGGTNQVNSRVMVYTENNLNTVAPNKAPTVNPATGADGGGLVGQTEPGYSVALFWGTTTGANNAPNTNADYVFGNPSVPVEGGTGNCVYIVDKRHTASYTTVGSALDNATLYRADGTAYTPANVLNDGLYPQLWDIDLYNSATIRNDTTKVSPSLYSTIATVMFGISTGAGADVGYYIGNVPELRTLANDDSVTARLSKADGTAGGEIYLALAGDFSGVPAQTYSTAKLTLAIVQN